MLGGGLAIVVVLLLLAPRGAKQENLPPDLTGCYEAASAPKIEIDKDSLRVIQRPALALPYKVEFNKGWALSLDASLDLVVRGTAVSIASRPSHGRFVFFTHEGELAPPTPGFTLYDVDGAYALRYALSGTRCALSGD